MIFLSFGRVSVFNSSCITWTHFFLLSSANYPKTEVPEGPEVSPGTPVWVGCVDECAVVEGEEYRDVVRMGRRRGVVLCSSDRWDEVEADNGLGEGLQEKGVGWWWEKEEFLSDKKSGGVAAMLAFL